MTGTEHPHGGYTLTRTSDGPATLNLHGVPVGVVELNPVGGHHRYEFTSPAAGQTYLRFAEALSPDALEPDDVLTDRLALTADLNASASVVFLLDDTDVFDGGRYRTYGPRVPFDDVVALLTGAHRPGGDVVPRVWVSARSQFVPITDLTPGDRARTAAA